MRITFAASEAGDEAAHRGKPGQPPLHQRPHAAAAAAPAKRRAAAPGALDGAAPGALVGSCGSGTGAAQVGGPGGLTSSQLQGYLQQGRAVGGGNRLRVNLRRG